MRVGFSRRALLPEREKSDVLPPVRRGRTDHRLDALPRVRRGDRDPSPAAGEGDSRAVVRDPVRSVREDGEGAWVRVARRGLIGPVPAGERCLVRDGSPIGPIRLSGPAAWPCPRAPRLRHPGGGKSWGAANVHGSRGARGYGPPSSGNGPGRSSRKSRGC